MRRMLFPLLAVLAFPLPTEAVNLTSERAVEPLSTAPAPFAQNTPSVASNGAFAAVWLDMRAAHDSTLFPPALYAARIENNGAAVPQFGRKLANATSAAIVASGNGYVVAYTTQNFVITVALDDNAVPIAEPQTIFHPAAAANLAIASLVAGDASILIAIQDFGALTTQVLLLEPDGTLRQPVEITGRIALDGQVAFGQGGFHFVHSVPCLPTALCLSTSIADDVIDASTAAVTSRPISNNIGLHHEIATAASGDRLLVAWMSEETIATVIHRFVGYALTDLTGSFLVINPRTIEVRALCDTCGTRDIGVGWDGAQFLVAFREAPLSSADNAPLRAMRVRPDGVLLDPQPVLLSDSAASAPSFAQEGSLQMLAWSDGAQQLDTDVVARITSSFNLIAADTAPTVVLARAPAAQQQAQIAAFGNTTIAVWRETSPGTSIAVSIAGVTAAPLVLAASPTATVHDPSINVAGDEALVTWIRDLPAGAQVLGRRVSSDGVILDAQPIVIFSGTAQLPPPIAISTAVASDGTDFFVAAVTADLLQVRGMRVRHDGTLIDTTPIDVSQPGAQFTGTPNRVRVVWTGSLYLVAWLSDPNPPFPVGRPPVFAYAVRAARVTAGGAVLDSTQSQTLFDGPGSAQGLTLTRVEDRVLIAWSAVTPTSASGASAAVSTMVAQRDGTLISAVPVVVSAARTNSADLASAETGDQPTLFWSDAGVVHAIQVDSDGRPTTGVLDISARGADAYGTAATALGDGFAVAYSRTVDDAQGGVGRLFVVTTDAAARRRSTRR